MKEDDIEDVGVGTPDAEEGGGKMPPKSDYDPTRNKDGITHHLSGMYQNWFLDYASYVILERAVPHIMDGFKPVQRRILHAMKQMDDGRFNKVANIVGSTMQYHPHGDASIKDALVQLGQKELLIDCQGNWGNILTGDDAAAGRYIEARLSKFALDVVFNPKTTEWKLSYDGRNKEPIALPVKFPLLLHRELRVLPWVFRVRFFLIISMKSVTLRSTISTTNRSSSTPTSQRVEVST